MILLSKKKYEALLARIDSLEWSAQRVRQDVNVLEERQRTCNISCDHSRYTRSMVDKLLDHLELKWEHVKSYDRIVEK